MNRIILGMAIANYALVALTMLLGLLSEPPGNVHRLGDAAFSYHFPLGILTALFTMFIHCIVFTYFLGTNRWVRETADAYSLDGSLVRSSQACRSRAMIVAVISILLVVATVASGAAVHTKVAPLWVHQLVPMLTYAFMLHAYRVEIDAVENHIGLTDRVMDEVNRIRAERGHATVA